MAQALEEIEKSLAVQDASLLTGNPNRGGVRLRDASMKKRPELEVADAARDARPLSWKSPASVA